MPSPTVTTRRAGRALEVILGGGPLTFDDAVEIEHVALAAADLDDINVVVLTSAGGDVCPGPHADLVDRLHEVDPAAALARLDVPIVAALGGAVRSVGLEIGLVADIRVGSSDARFSLPDLSAGRLPQWGGTQRLPRAVGRQTATAMILLGTELDAETAHTRGLVHEITPTTPEAIERARSIAAQIGDLAPIAVRYAKEAVLRGSEMDLVNGLKLEGDLNTLLQVSADRAEGLTAFFEKRSPQFTGR